MEANSIHHRRVHFHSGSEHAIPHSCMQSLHTEDAGQPGSSSVPCKYPFNFTLLTKHMLDARNYLSQPQAGQEEMHGQTVGRAQERNAPICWVPARTTFFQVGVSSY